MPAGQKQGKISLITSKCFTTQLGAIVTTMGFLRYDLSSSTKRGWQVSRILIAIQDGYLSEHLNQDKLKQTIKVHITPLTKYIKIGKWDLSN